MKFLFAFLLVLTSAYESAAFEVIEGTETDPEGAKIETMILVMPNQRYEFRPPHGYSLRVDSVKYELRFSATNKTAISIQFSDEYPTGLPAETTLQANVLNRYFGAAILRSSAYPSGLKPGWLIDVKRVFTPEISLITRHVFLPRTHGTIQFIFSSDSEEFESHRHVFNGLLNSFRPEQ